MKILHLIDSGGLYGAEKVLLTLCSEQIKQGLDPVILSCGMPGEAPKPLELAAERLGIRCKSWRMKSGLNLKGMRDVWRWVHEEGFTHLHSHGYKFNILMAMTKRYASGAKLITTLHGYTSQKLLSKAGIQQAIDRVLLVRFDSVCWVGAKDALSGLVKLLNKGRISYINNGVALRSPSFSRARGKVEKLLVVGRLSEEKGLVFAVQAIRALRSQGIMVQLTVVGDGPLKSDLQGLAEALNVSDFIDFRGFVEDVYPLYESHDLLLIPSLTEGLPLVLLEALIYELPVIASSVGAIPEVIQDSTFLIPRPDASGPLISKVLNWVRLDYDEQRKLVQPISRRVKELYSGESMANSYRKVYEDLNVGV